MYDHLFAVPPDHGMGAREMKALVLAGGAGTRLRPLTYSMPKQLIPIANIPVLEYVIRNIGDAGVEEIGVVVGDRADQIIAAIGDGSRFGTKITYIHQERPLGLAHCVLLAGDFLADSDFVMYLGDNMLPDGITEVAREFRDNRPAAQVVMHSVPNPGEFGIVELDARGRVARLVEKPARPQSDLALIGVYFFTPAIHEAIGEITPSARGELEITDAVQWLLAHGHEIKASEYTGYWKDTGRVEDVLTCNRTLLDRLPSQVAGEIDESSSVDSRVIVEAGARVSRSRVDGPAIIGAGTVIEDSLIGPNVSIGRNCRLRDTLLSDSIVMDEASISRVPGLHHSLVGRSAIVAPGGDGGLRHRLVVGDHTRVEIAA